MLEVIEKLLILQDRDRKIIGTRNELASIDPQRQSLQTKAAQSQAGLDAAKLHGKQIETERKKLELEVEAKQQLIQKYSIQQFQTKKNEEYRALAKEIDTCREGIRLLEDQQIVLMEQAELVDKEVALAKVAAEKWKKDADSQLAELAEREANLQKQLEEYASNRDDLATGVEEGALARYERLLRHRGEKVVVGIDHGVCGGCHMKLPIQIVVSCQGQHELVACPNCGRILYYSRDMDLAVAE
jgi:uncharacterized protein